MRSHKAVVFNFCICTTKNTALTRITHYQHGWRLQGWATRASIKTLNPHASWQKKVGIRRPPQPIKGIIMKAATETAS